MISVTIPMSLCPPILGKNGGHAWGWTKHYRAFRDQKRWAELSLLDAVSDDMPWSSATMFVEWCYCRGRQPDDDNCIARLSGVRDAFQSQRIVENDMYVSIGKVTFTKVKSGDECVVVTLRRDES